MGSNQTELLDANGQSEKVEKRGERRDVTCGVEENSEKNQSKNLNTGLDRQNAKLTLYPTIPK